MKIFELTLAIVFAAGGIRSIWVWSRRRFAGRDVTDHLLYALFVTGRVGMWFAIALLFAIYASIDVRGRAALDELVQYRWLLIVLLLLGVAQVIGGYFLSRRGDDPRTGDDPETP